MGFFEILLISVGLAMDAFAIAIGIGSAGRARGPGPVFRLSFHFGLFQFLMPILGWLAGSTFAEFISSIDHWVAFALLAFVGGHMIRSGLDPNGQVGAKDPTRGRSLVMLSVATSIDAFAIGLGLAMLQVSIILPSLIIGIVAAVFTLVGLEIGNRLGEVFGKRMELIGGLILIVMGIRVLISHML
ncbi:MAG: manganese efflux pump MntP family protein [Chloroflexi bacterium]|nr:manganese efflux pump MntP family protein [Chloroflexota bacterium]